MKIFSIIVEVFEKYQYLCSIKKSIMRTEAIETKENYFDDDVIVALKSKEETISVDEFFDLLHKEVKKRYENA